MPPEVLALLARHRAEVGRMLSQIDDEILAAWVRVWGDLENELLRRPWPESARERIARIEQAKRIAAQRILAASQATGTILTARARTMIERGLWEQPELITAQLPAAAQVSIVRPPSDEVDRIIRRSVEQITKSTYTLSEEATTAMRRALNLGMAAGDNPREVAARMIEEVKGAFNGGLNRALVIARTEMVDAHRGAAEASQAANSDVLAGWRWWASLGPRTCPSCVGQHGQLHDLDEPGPLDHHQGRCARLPVTKTWEELGFIGIPEKRPHVETGPEWLARQPESVQRSMLGPKRFEAWQAGDYPPSAWSVRKETDGWRDSYHVGPVSG